MHSNISKQKPVQLGNIISSTDSNDIEATRYERIEPTRDISEDKVEDSIEFLISKSRNPSEFLSLGDTKIYCRFRVVQLDAASKLQKLPDVEYKPEDKSKPVSGATPAPLPLAPLSCFKDVEVKFNEQTVSNSADLLFPYQVYWKTLLKSGLNGLGDKKATFWHPDTPKYMQEIEPWGSNAGLFSRWERIKSSEEVEFYGPLMVDCFSHQRELLPPGVEVKLRFVKADPAFYILAKNSTNRSGYSVKIDEMCLVLKWITPKKDLLNALDKFVKAKETEIHLEENRMSKNVLSEGTREISIRIPYFGKSLPNRIHFALIKSDQSRGTYDSNPFDMQLHKLKSIKLLSDTKSVVAEIPFCDNIEQNQKPLLAWGALAARESTKEALDGRVATIPIDAWKNGYGLSTLPIPQNLQYCELSLEFQEPLAYDVTAILMENITKSVRFKKLNDCVQLKDQLENELDDMIVYYRDDPDLQSVIDSIQKDWLHCCGIKSPDDWEMNIYFNKSSASSHSLEAGGVPFSCCRTDAKLTNFYCGHGVRLREYTGNTDYFRVGCIQKFREWLHRNVMSVGIALVVVAVLEILGICFAQNLRSDIFAQKARWQYER